MGDDTLVLLSLPDIGLWIQELQEGRCCVPARYPDPGTGYVSHLGTVAECRIHPSPGATGSLCGQVCPINALGSFSYLYSTY